jgi:hypothetical protein
VPLFQPLIPHVLTWAWTTGQRGENPATNRLSYGTAEINHKHFYKFWEIKTCETLVLCPAD